MTIITTLAKEFKKNLKRNVNRNKSLLNIIMNNLHYYYIITRLLKKEL